MGARTAPRQCAAVDGAAAGDRVAVLEDNTLEAADFFLGTAAANLVRVPLYRRNASEAHLFMLEHTHCKAVVVSEPYLHELDGITEAMPDLQIIVRGGDYESWLMSHPSTDPDPDIDLDDVFIIRHSAGTAGRAKGIAYTHRAWMSATRDWFYMLPPVDMGDTCLHVGPISHGSGYLFLPVFLGGGTNILHPKFDADGMLRTVREQQARTSSPSRRWSPTSPARPTGGVRTFPGSRWSWCPEPLSARRPRWPDVRSSATRCTRCTGRLRPCP